MKKLTLSICLLALAAMGQQVTAQKVLDAKETVKEVKKDDKLPEGWARVGGIGADFSMLTLINPREGAGDNRVGVGGLLTFSANYAKGKIIWNNRFNLQAAAVKIANDPWTKANDVLQATAQFGYRISGEWYGAALADVQTQLLPTFGKNFLRQVATIPESQTKTGAFFAPAIARIAPGFIYKPNAHFNVLISPFALKSLIVNNDSIASLPVWGPVIKKGVYFDNQAGAEIRADYTRKFFNDKLVYTAVLDLYTNYLRDFGLIDVEFYNSIDIVLFKNISLNLKSDWFYDHDILVRKSDGRRSYGVFGRNAFFLKFNRLF